MEKSKSQGTIETYDHPAGGWGAVKYVAINLIKEKVAGGNYRTLFKQKTAYEIPLRLVGSEMCIRDRLPARPEV